MSLERWRKVEAIFLAALERRPQERAAFLSEVCDDDAELRVQVEGMLDADGQSNLIDASVTEVAADLLIAVDGTLAPGQTVNQYEVIRELGRGGMGQVYLAQDSRLDRPVALKLLPHTFSKDPERVRRFQQEARVVSALNHPCIITIHEIGETDGLRFIVTEFVDGETLREIIRRGERDLNRTLKIFTQVAEALAAAHSVGIVHRDIKPENIMVRGDGYVKVLDFGLAKPTVDWPGKARSRESQPSNFTTSPGLILGTVKYMSPEQARGYDVDARTDIFSLGVVLYESVTGSAPFTGKTNADMLIAIAGEEPKPIAEFLRNAPARLQQIVDKSLQKNAADRYQTVAEMRTDLEDLRDGLAKHSAVQSGKGATDAVAVLPSSPRLAGESVRNKVKTGLAVGTTLVVIVALAVGLYWLFLARSKKALFSPANLHFTKLTAQGTSDSGSISADGKYVAYVSDKGNSSGALVLRQTATENTVQLVPPRPGFSNWGCEFTPDGNYLFCWYIERADQRNSFFERIPLIPGRTEKVIDQVGSGPAFSPDGKHLAFVRIDSRGRRLVITELDGKNARDLANQDERHFLFRSVAWSADGKIVAAIDLVRESGCDPCYQVTGFRIDDGTKMRLTADHWDNIRKIVWLPDNTGFLMSAKDRAGSNEGLWLVSYPGGQAQRLTNELSIFEGLSITADGKTLLTSQAERPMTIWVSPVADPTRAQKLTPIEGEYTWPTWTPDGRLIYVLGSDLWIMNADGSERKQLTFSLRGATHPDVSPDGRFIVFSSPRTGKYNIWRLELASGELKQITNGSIEQWPLYSPDGKWIIYRSFAEGKTFFWKMPVDGGSATPIGESNLDTAMLAISPDNRLIAYQYLGSKGENTAIRLFDGGPVEKTWDQMGGYNRQFTSDGKDLIYSDINNLWMQPLSEGSPKRLTNFTTTEHMLWFSLSRDGQNLAFARGNWIWDIVLINVK
jgi:serine/threonine protein kinase/Tol biopolymer transport system component